MKKNLIKTLFAAICVVAAGLGGMKAYDAANQSNGTALLVENVEALSSGEQGFWCHSSEYGSCATNGSDVHPAYNIRVPGWWP